jgi:hypothetical protein
MVPLGMQKTIEKNMILILQVLGQQERSEHGEAWMSGQMLGEATKLEPAEINDAVDLLAARDLVERLQTLDTAPYDFATVTITARGRYELERMVSQEQARGAEAQTLSLLPPTPVGSPFGFTDQDWETVVERKSRRGELRVVLGRQFESSHYDRDALEANIKGMFQKAVEDYNKQPGAIQVTLDFQPLQAGYGGHLFNEIARDIISADIAIFETSDLNPNVMIEMGVALTWGVRVLPIKKEGCQKPPSDISGQTWADYRNNGAEFPNPHHFEKLISMIDRAARKKGKV